MTPVTIADPIAWLDERIPGWAEHRDGRLEVQAPVSDFVQRCRLGSADDLAANVPAGAQVRAHLKAVALDVEGRVLTELGG